MTLPRMAEIQALEIENATALTEVYGYWPSFHDAEVLSITLARDGLDGPHLEVGIHVWEMTSEIDDRGYYVRRSHRVVTLRFARIAREQVAWFNHQNVLAGAVFEPAVAPTDPHDDQGPRRWRVLLQGTYGCTVEVDCDRIEVRSVEPCDTAT